MKNKAILILLVLFIFCVGCVSATDTDNINNTMIQDNPDNNIADEIDIEKNNINSTNEPNNIDNDDKSKNKIENNNLTEKKTIIHQPKMILNAILILILHHLILM